MENCNGIIEKGWCKSCGKAEAPANEICFFDDPFWFPDKKQKKVKRNLPSFRPSEDNSNFWHKKKFPSTGITTRAFVFHRDNHQCLACGSLNDLTLDHIIPRVAGGGGQATNLQTLCGSCNRRKGERIRDFRLLKNTIKSK